MEINLSKFMGGVSVFISIALIGAFGYFIYDVAFSGPGIQVAASIDTVNASAFGPKMQKAATALSGGKAGKIALKKKDLAVTESALFKSFTDLPEEVPLSDSRGRPNPFVPYVAP